MICFKSSPEGGPHHHHHPGSPSPGGWVDKLSAPSPSFRRQSTRFLFPFSLFFSVSLTLFLLMWGLSFSSSLTTLFFSFPPLIFSILFFPFYALLVMRGLGFWENQGAWIFFKPILNVTTFGCVCTGGWTPLTSVLWWDWRYHRKESE